jgi:hypothetical protein
MDKKIDWAMECHKFVPLFLFESTLRWGERLSPSCILYAKFNYISLVDFYRMDDMGIKM